MKVKKNNAIVIFVRDGVVEDVLKPKKYLNVKVEVRDYDAPEENERTIVGENGDVYERTIY